MDVKFKAVPVGKKESRVGFREEKVIAVIRQIIFDRFCVSSGIEIYWSSFQFMSSRSEVSVNKDDVVVT